MSTRVKIINFLFSMNYYFIKSISKLQKSNQFTLGSVCEFCTLYKVITLEIDYLAKNVSSVQGLGPKKTQNFRQKKKKRKKKKERKSRSFFKLQWNESTPSERLKPKKCGF